MGNRSTWLCRLLSMLCAACSLLLSTSSADQSFPDALAKDYCEDERFEAQCGDDEVIVMQTARYGRMQLGRCITSGYGQMGCWRDVMKQFDQWCSGRRSCDVAVRDLVMFADPACPKDLRSYLLASFYCVKVTKVSVDECHGGQLSLVASSTGYIASVVTQKTGCGSIDSPWLVQTDSGQRINISLVDFSRREQQYSPGGAVMCQVLAVVKEQDRSETICRGNQREQHVYQSLTSQVEIRLMVKKEDPVQQSQFLLKYEAMGCPDVPVNEATWFRRTPTGATVGCHGSNKRWKLSCHGLAWKGTYYNCTQAGIVTEEGESKSGRTFPFGISIAIVVIIALTIGTLVLVVGLICVRRRRVPRPPNPPLRTSKQKAEYYVAGERPPSGNHPPGSSHDPSLLPGFGENAYFRTWELQRPNNNGSYPVSSPNRDLPSYSQAVDSHTDRYSEHIYESPKSIRKGGSNGNESMQYYELDPHAMDKGRAGVDAL